MASRSINMVILKGNLTRNPELSMTQNGIARCTFGVATNSYWKGADGSQQEDTEFHNIVCWGKLAEICNQYLKVGMKVFVQGEIRHRNWVDQEGKKHYMDEVKASEVDILSPKSRDENGGMDSGVEENVTKQDQAPVEDDAPIDITDLPF